MSRGLTGWSYVFRPLGSWPIESTPGDLRRSRHTFKAAWTDTVDLLEREIEHLDGRNVVIQADFSEADIRLDGMIRANPRQPDHPGVIISFDSVHGPLQYMTDTHAFWQHNIRAIALGLQALRAVDRYGVTRRGEQYTGWKALPSGGSGPTSRQAAITVIALLSQMSSDDVESAFAAGTGKGIYRRALAAAHPDHGGNSESLNAVLQAGQLLGVG